ncbi:MAG: hypothetical protein NC307_11985 [Roseburia sp.]|nr:hypothetical protein [Roseburia sp.]
MAKKFNELWESLDVPVLVNKREMVLVVTVCALAGILLGILFSPKKSTTIGSNNGNNSGNGNFPEEEED